MIKTYLVPITDEVIKAMESGEAPSFLHCATCLDDLTNGEVFIEMNPNVEVLSDTEDSVYVSIDRDIVSFSRRWWSRKWGE